MEHWIELGLPDAKRLRRAMGRADRVSVYAYGGQDLEQWWQRLRRESTPHKPMQIWALDAEPVAAWEQALQRTMQINCVIDDGDCYISWESASADADEGGQIALRPSLIDQHNVKP